MAKYPILDLHSSLKECKIFVSVGEASNSKCSGKLTVVISDVNNGEPNTIVKNLSELGYPLKEILIDETPKTGKIHPVIATLVLDTGENKTDNEIIEMCAE